MWGNIYDINKNDCKQIKNDDGYFFVKLKYGPRVIDYLVHEFVGECYHCQYFNDSDNKRDPIINKKDRIIYHLNGNKNNNMICNLTCQSTK